MDKIYILYAEKCGFSLQGIPHTSSYFFKACFPSYAALLVALLNHLIYSVPLPNVDDFLLLDNTISIESIRTYINDIFLCSIDDCFEQDTPSERYAVHTAADRTLRNPAFTAEYYTDKLPLAAAAREENTTLTFLEREIQVKYGPMSEERASAYTMRQVAQMRNIKIHGADQYCFPNLSSLILWLIGQVARANQRLSICPVCEHYFLPKRSNQKYCSPSCRRDNMNSAAFHGEKEITRMYRRIHSLFYSKVNISKETGYSYSVRETRDQDYTAGKTYDIANEKESFEIENSNRLTAFNTAYKEMKKNPSSNNKEAYNQQKESYLNWLQEVHKKAKALRLTKDAIPENKG